MYQARKVLADEVPFEVDAACPLPLSLPNVTRPLPPCADAVRALLAPLEALAPPPPVKAPPPRLPKVPTGHVDRAAGVPAFLVTGEEAEGGLVRTPPSPTRRLRCLVNIRGARFHIPVCSNAARRGRKALLLLVGAWLADGGHAQRPRPPTPPLCLTLRPGSERRSSAGLTRRHRANESRKLETAKSVGNCSV